MNTMTRDEILQAILDKKQLQEWEAEALHKTSWN